ncbi:tautomerase family protein [Sphingomonas sp. ac-8]|uniref:tautomerase family protein n=1 Tax=Sphingomonas sp. ac-8 TaxID=3242977 RepID=UPI003A7FD5DD
MPHVHVKMYAGRSDGEKQDLADRITQAVTTALGHDDDAVSVAIEDVQPTDWMVEVYDRDIRANEDRLFKQPGYSPLK